MKRKLTNIIKQKLRENGGRCEECNKILGYHRSLYGRELLCKECVSNRPLTARAARKKLLQSMAKKAFCRIHGQHTEWTFSKDMESVECILCQRKRKSYLKSDLEEEAELRKTNPELFSDE